ncbi:MAG: replicative DNA helicase [Myxococcota bacterium]|nr:replicative DNA helicase [Myxococcota bacterium]
MSVEGFTGDVGRRGGKRRGGAALTDEATSTVLEGRVPPNDLSAEKAVLSAVLLDNAVIHSIVTEIKEEDFYHPAHQLLYHAMVRLKDENQPVDLTTLAAHLEANALLEAVGGVVTLADIADYEATPANATHYAKIIRDKSTKRKIIHTASEIVALGYDQTESADRLLDAAESRIFGLSTEQAKTTLSSIGVQMHDAVNHIDQLMSRSGELTGLSTGYAKLDELTGGFQPGDLIILAARPSMGKTALALNVGRNAAVDHGKKVAVFSLEMTTRSLVMRLLSSEAQVDFSAFRRGLISTEAHGRLMQAAGRLAEAGIWIDDTGAATVLEMRAKARRLHAQHGLDMVVVDYLQLAHGDGGSASREQEISEISRGLKGLAKELDIPVLALSQLNRGPESRKEDKRPMLADLRESGAIEQDADVIAFIYRDIVYNKETEFENLAELIIAKQRNGPTDTVRLEFEGRFAQFRDWTASENPYDGASGSAHFSAVETSPFGPGSGSGGGFGGPDGGSGFDDDVF